MHTWYLAGDVDLILSIKAAVMLCAFLCHWQQKAVVLPLVRVALSAQGAGASISIPICRSFSEGYKCWNSCLVCHMACCCYHVPVQP